MKKLLVILFCCAVLRSDALAVPGTSGSRFLLLGVGGRAVAMGEAFAGLSDDASAAYWNPAGLTQLQGVEFLSMYNSWFEGVNHLYAGLAMKVDGKRALAIQANALAVGDIPRVDGTGVLEGAFGASDVALAATYAQRVRDKISLSVGVKIIRETIDRESGVGFGIDVGGLYKPVPRLGIGFAVRNAGQGIKYINDTSPLPTEIRAGVGYKVIERCLKEFTVTGDVAMMPADNTVTANLGGELVVSRMIALRSGAKIGKTVVPTFGIGFTIRNISIDWATELFGDLGNPNRLSVSLKFGSVKDVAK
jgi:hypothetical protein